MAIPTITIGTPSRTKISSVNGYDRATVTFKSDVALNKWEARATTEGQTIGHGSGLLVESGGILETNTEATIYIDDEELTSGDREYIITIFGLGTDGYWSDGTFENLNVLDFTQTVTSNATITDGTMICDTGTANDGSYIFFFVERYAKWGYLDEILYAQETGSYTVNITLNLAEFDTLKLGFYGGQEAGGVYFNVDYLEEGNYVLSFNLETLTANKAVASGIQLVKVVV